MRLFVRLVIYFRLNRLDCGISLKVSSSSLAASSKPIETFNLAADGSVVDWFGVKKSGYYTATRKVYSQVDVSLTYSSLFLLANEPLPPITPWVVSERSVQGSLSLSVSTTAGKSLHEQSWTVNVTVPSDEMGVALEMPSPVPTPLNSCVHPASHLTVMITKETCSNTSEQVSWAMPPGELAGEVLLFRLTLTPASSADAAASSDGISSQLYTFAVLPPGSSVPTPLNQSLQSFSSISVSFCAAQIAVKYLNGSFVGTGTRQDGQGPADAAAPARAGRAVRPLQAGLQ